MKPIFITARTKSSRLPNKCLLEVYKGKTAIEFLIDRLNWFGYMPILCTSDSEEDDALIQIARNNAIFSYRGPEEDKLKRWIDCADYYDVDFFVTADGDDLFVETELINLAFKQHEEKGHKFINCPNTPSGSFSWGIDVKALKRVYKNNAINITNTEMGFCWFDDVHELENIPKEYLRKDVRMTLDYQDDLDFFRTVIEAIGNKPLKDILALLDENKEVININIHREEDWKNNQQKQIGNIK
jgi:spore coat polysaccharide biosynthesis protein SpsF